MYSRCSYCWCCLLLLLLLNIRFFLSNSHETMIWEIYIKKRKKICTKWAYTLKISCKFIIIFVFLQFPFIIFLFRCCLFFFFAYFFHSNTHITHQNVLNLFKKKNGNKEKFLGIKLDSLHFLLIFPNTNAILIWYLLGFSFNDHWLCIIVFCFCSYSLCFPSIFCLSVACEKLPSWWKYS